MSILGHIIKYKALEDERDQRRAMSIINATDKNLQQRQIRELMKLKRQEREDLLGERKSQREISLAKIGMRREGGQIVRDDSLRNQLDILEDKSKGATATIKIRENITKQKLLDGIELTSEEEKYKNDVMLKQKEKEKTPSWGQEQKIEAIRSGLKRGKIVLGKEWGEPSVYEPKTMDEALSAITEAKLDPTLFEEELSRYEEITIQDKRGKPWLIPAYQLEQALKEGYTKVK